MDFWSFIASSALSETVLVDAFSKILNIKIWDEYRKAALSDNDIIHQADRISGLIYCRYDVLQPENLAEYRRLLPGKKHHVLNECGHFPWEEMPDEYFRMLYRLIN